jgi:hypothetical protein
VAEEASNNRAATDVAEGFRAIVLRVADFFDIFDLSFMISGVVALAALSYWVWRAQIPIPDLPEGWIRNIGLVLASYVLGLLCFAMGRWFRSPWRRRRTGGGAGDRLLKILEAHGLSETIAVRDYLRRVDSTGEARLYVRLWAEVRQSAELTPSFYLLRRYWVMAATYDGMVSALIVWILTIGACILGLAGTRPMSVQVGLLLLGLLVLCVIACSREAARLVDYQMEELVASIAALRTQK